MKTNLQALIIEDEDAAVNRLKKELNRLGGVTFSILGIAASVEKSMELLTEFPEVDLIFMDIQLSDGISFELFDRVDVHRPVIFTTAYDEYALQAFKVNSIDYLLKPIDPDELQGAINRYLEQQSSTQSDPYDQLMRLAKSYKPTTYRSSFLVSYRQKMMMVDINEVAYMYVKERGVFLKRKDGVEYLVDFFLDDLEKQLDPAKFYRANRQFLVARSAIQEIEPYFNGRLVLSMKPEAFTSVIVSKEKATHFKRWADY